MLSADADLLSVSVMLVLLLIEELRFVSVERPTVIFISLLLFFFQSQLKVTLTRGVLPSLMEVMGAVSIREW